MAGKEFEEAMEKIITRAKTHPNDALSTDERILLIKDRALALIGIARQNGMVRDQTDFVTTIMALAMSAGINAARFNISTKDLSVMLSNGVKYGETLLHAYNEDQLFTKMAKNPKGNA